MREVKYAKTHTEVFVPGIGTIGPTFTADDMNNPKNTRVTMTVSEDDNFLVISYKGTDIDVPMHNVVLMVRRKA